MTSQFAGYPMFRVRLRAGFVEGIEVQGTAARVCCSLAKPICPLEIVGQRNDREGEP
jgi:hypothetical protein